jgi:hypothetical protein
MTDTDDTPHADPARLEPPEEASVIGRIFIWILALLVVAGCLAVGAYYLQTNGYGFPAPITNPAAANENASKIAAIEKQIQALTARVDELTTRLDDMATAPAAENAGTAKLSAADLAHVQNNLSALAATVNGLEADVKQAGSTAAALRAETSATLAETIAFLQLQAAAMSGHGFAHELETMQNAAKMDPSASEPLGRLAPLAENGAPDTAILRDRFSQQISAADRAIAKATAETWWQRLLAELKGLVSIRPLHGAATADTTLEAMQAALEHGDLGAALDKIDGLPPEAQAALADWRQEAEARRTINAALRALSDHFTAGAAAAQDAP